MNIILDANSIMPMAELCDGIQDACPYICSPFRCSHNGCNCIDNSGCAHRGCSCFFY